MPWCRDSTFDTADFERGAGVDDVDEVRRKGSRGLGGGMQRAVRNNLCAANLCEPHLVMAPVSFVAKFVHRFCSMLRNHSFPFARAMAGVSQEASRRFSVQCLWSGEE